MRIRLFTITALMASAMFAQTTDTAATKPDPAARRTAMLTRMLNLDASQQTQVKAILADAATANQNSQTQLKDLHTKLITAVKNNDSGGISAITQQMSAPRQQMDAARASSAAKIYALLTADQKAKVDDGLEMLIGMGGGPGMGGPGGPGMGGPGMRGGPRGKR